MLNIFLCEFPNTESNCYRYGKMYVSIYTNGEKEESYTGSINAAETTTDFTGQIHNPGAPVIFFGGYKKVNEAEYKYAKYKLGAGKFTICLDYVKLTPNSD